MKLKLTVIILFLTSVILLINEHAKTNSLTPPPARTGAPGENTCAYGCHIGALNNGPANIQLSISDNSYLPDSIYQLTVDINDASKAKFGFQLTSLDGNNNQAGSFILGANTSNQSAIGRRYISHKSASSNSNWTFEWKAPNFDAGAVSFYLSANAANGNNTSSGDNIYTREFILNSELSVSTSEVDPFVNRFIIYPNPATDYLNVRFSPEFNSSLSLNLLDINGRIVLQMTEYQELNGEYNRQFSLKNVKTSGIYFLSINVNGIEAFKRLIIYR